MPNKVKLPRRIFLRQALRLLARMLLPMLADIRVTGQENFPRQGPLIVVGNHTAIMEVVMMAVYPPWIIEFIGSTDIPHEKFTAYILGLYGYLPVFRGNATPSSLKTGLEVLEQNGILGIFPEGGIWEPSIRRAQSGVAWLSYHAQVPILPIGFGSMRGALKKMFSFKRPVLKMRVGKLIPAIQTLPGKPRKLLFQDEAKRIMDAVWELIPEEDRVQEQTIAGECFELGVDVEDLDKKQLSIPPELELHHGAAFSKFTHRNTLINNFILNLNMPEVAPLRRLADGPALEEIISATDSILDYLNSKNPYYFTYRYGQREGRAMEAGIREVYNLTLWAREAQFSLKIKPIRRFKNISTGKEVLLDRPDEFEKL